jgi:L-threonylcarbamoyladenylate synthase
MHISALPFLTLEAAGEALVQGKTILFPTETFYALGCDAMNPDAVNRIYSIKKRIYSMPLPVIIGAREKLACLVSHVTPSAERLMDSFWPGPLSVVLPANVDVPECLTAQSGRIAVRLSSHPAAQRLCRTADKVLVASSANVSGEPPVTRPEDIAPEILMQSAGFYVFGAEPAGGLPSTIVDVLEGQDKEYVRILRYGAISSQALKAYGFAVIDAAVSRLMQGSGER